MHEGMVLQTQTLQVLLRYGQAGEQGDPHPGEKGIHPPLPDTFTLGFLHGCPWVSLPHAKTYCEGSGLAKKETETTIK